MKTSLNDFINEGISSILYHFTYPSVLTDMLESDEILLSSGLGTSSDNDESHKKFFLSTSRTGSFKQGYGADKQCRIELDGVALGRTLSGKAFNYWGNKDPEKSPYYKGYGDQTGDHAWYMAKQFEYEDRIVSYKPVIKNARKYIKSVVLVNTRQESDYLFKVALEECEKHKIPVTVYRTHKDAISKKNEISDEVRQATKPEDNGWTSSESAYAWRTFVTIAALVMYDKTYIDNYDLFVKDYQVFMKKHGLPVDKVEADKVHDRMRSFQFNGRYNSDMVLGMQADLHNFYKGGKRGPLRDKIDMLTNDMRKHGCASIQQLVDLKVSGLRPKIRGKNNKGISKNWELLSYGEPVAHDEVYGKWRYYQFQGWKYGGYMDEEDMTYLYKIEQDGTVGDFLDYLLGKYTEERAKYLVMASGSTKDGEKTMELRKR